MTADLSVVIPVRNRPQSVLRTIESIREDDARTAIIVVDDASMDDTVDMVRSAWGGAVQLIEAPQHLGVSAARNLGAESATTDFLAFLDSDDEVRPGWAEVLVRGASSTGLACCGAEISSEGRIKVEVPRDLGPVFRHRKGLFLAGSYALRRDVFERAGRFDTEMSFGENTELAMRLVDEVTEVTCDERTLLLVHGRRRRTEHDSGRYHSAVRLLEKHRGRLALEPRELASYYAIASKGAERAGDYRESVRWQLHAAKAAPSVKNVLRLGRPLLARLSRRSPV